MNVSGYYRSNGTYVSGYTRATPSSSSSSSGTSGNNSVSGSSSGSGTVNVSGYYRSNGTYTCLDTPDQLLPILLRQVESLALVQ